jgi:hypothetical protein
MSQLRCSTRADKSQSHTAIKIRALPAAIVPGAEPRRERLYSEHRE